MPLFGQEFSNELTKTFELLLTSVSTVSTFPGELDLFEERGRQVRLHGRQELRGHLRRKVHRSQRVSGEEMLPSWWSNAASSAYTLQHALSVVASIDSINLLHWGTPLFLASKIPVTLMFKLDFSGRAKAAPWPMAAHANEIKLDMAIKFDSLAI